MDRQQTIVYQVKVIYEDPVDMDEARGSFLLALQSFIQSVGGLAGLDPITITEKVVVDCITERSRFVMDLQDWSFEFVEVAYGD